MSLSLYLNVAITVAKLVAYLQTYSLSVLAALLDSVLDVVSQFVLNYTEQHSSMQRSSAFYPAGASRLEPIGVLTCAALMGMASFEVLKESITVLLVPSSHDLKPKLSTMYGMILIVGIKLALLWLCRRGALRRPTSLTRNTNNKNGKDTGIQMDNSTFRSKETSLLDDEEDDYDIDDNERAVADRDEQFTLLPNNNSNKVVVLDDHFSSATTKLLLQVQQQPPPVEYRIADPTLEALSLDHWNDCLSNGVAAIALLCSVRANATLWFLDPVGAIVISLYIIYSWYTTGKEQIEHLTGKSAPEEFIEELVDLANGFDERIIVDTVRAYHFGPKFLVEIEIVMDASTLLFESHDVGMELQYEIEGREEVERCFVHIDYQTRPYDEHVVSKVPELRDKYTKQPSNHKLVRSSQSL